MATRFTELVGCSAPIQQAPMGGVSSDELCAAVSEAGGLGMISGAGMSAELLQAKLDHVRSLTAKPIGVNFLIPVLDRECLRLASRSVRVVDFFWGEPDPQLVAFAHEGGALVSWQVGTVAEAIAAERAGCDVVIAQGVEAGGHIWGTLGLLPLLSQVLDEVSVPVLAAGGIGSARSLAAVLAAGAAGARCGTRFAAAAESAAHPTYVEALIRARAEDAVRTDLFHVGCPLCPSTHGVLKSAIEAAESLASDVVGEMEMQGRTFPIAKFHGVPPFRPIRGHVEAMALYAGQSVGGVHGVQTAAEIVAELLGDAGQAAAGTAAHSAIA
ncbi:MAG TPA: nitronate monooxygenase [Dehalococcoidia bacterium]|nr:nitronate monooxygenase [Dehalococcoidia bacterium]